MRIWFGFVFEEEHIVWRRSLKVRSALRFKHRYNLDLIWSMSIGSTHLAKSTSRSGFWTWYEIYILSFIAIPGIFQGSNSYVIHICFKRRVYAMNWIWFEVRCLMPQHGQGCFYVWAIFRFLCIHISTYRNFCRKKQSERSTKCFPFQLTLRVWGADLCRHPEQTITN